ncbi:YciI-like protein [Marivirga sp.]|uniref:YciI-like protein n=1 Tax=Marivirga sp. TaxID=2018662 RepID=UPI0025E2AECC|nr:YciI-like protein [Marivirga sp.]
MNYYLLFYKTIENYVEKRAPYRSEHLKLAEEAHQKGYIIMAGAMAEPADGAILIFKGESPKIAEDFAKNDPYVKNGLIKSWEVRHWTVVVGQNS